MSTRNVTSIRQARQQAGIKPGAFARLVGISASGLRNVENGHRRPSAELHNRIARVLGLPPHQLRSASEDGQDHGSDGPDAIVGGAGPDEPDIAA